MPDVRTRGADLVLTGGRVITMSPSRDTATALAVRDGRVLLVGTDSEVLAARHDGTQVVDLRGRTVVPGFIDGHTHVELTSYSRHIWTDVRGRSVEEVLQTIKELAAQTAPGEWIVLQGTFGQVLPDRQALDAATSAHPVAVRWSMHKCQLNSLALAVSGITRSTIAPPGSRIQRDSSGEPTGLIEEGWDLLNWRPALRDAVKPAIVETLTSLFLANGVTTVNEIVASPTGLSIYQELAETGTIPRMGLALTAAPGHQPLINATEFAALGFQSGFGDDRLRLAAIKIFVDGGRDGALRSSLMSSPALEWGLLTRTPQRLAEEVSEAAANGLQMWVHAIGDLAQEVAVSAIEQAALANPGVDHRSRIEHFANEMYEMSRLRRLVDAGGIAAPNIGFIMSEPDDPAKRLPPGVTKYAARTLKEVTGRIPGNSDTAGAQPFTCNPWFVMKCMLVRENKNGVLISPEEAVSLDDALASFTIDSAYATKQEHEKGSLEAGKFADFAVLAEDPYAMPAERLDEMVTEATVIGGKVVYGAF
ncbi:amidohydrolase [Planosporangium flavigriseum]|uniref:Amidohydrolase n=1 Tax=Planosporangium flavigriseum TaxID=373681 RepID=A0A8J3LQR1_9ACTN|nr:amidohydrolase [Planosporangium flavigriseum]NJC66062.1 amidohydrolase [Planosporangium flavigriseum]GIG75095.1 amidohydrolase [Planosporangium flavigriseum]